MIVRSRWTYVRRKQTIGGFLDALGVSYRKGGSFWEKNRGILGDIYSEMIDGARERYRELHPDYGGDGAQFGEFIKDLEYAKKQFARNGGIFSKPQPTPETVIFIPASKACPGRKGTPGGFIHPEKASKVLQFLRENEDLETIEVSRQLGVSVYYVERIRKLLPPVFCQCGRRKPHAGYCNYKVAPPGTRLGNYKRIRPSEATKEKMRRSAIARWKKQKGLTDQIETTNLSAK